MQRRIEEHQINLKDKRRYFILTPSGIGLNDLVLSNNVISTSITNLSHFDKLNELVENSHHTIKLSTFLFDDVDLAEVLIQASYRLKGGVYILTSILDRNLRDAFGYTKDQENKHLKVLKLLEKSPVAVRCVPGLHGKFWSFDNKIGVITSANLTTNSLHNVTELGIIMTNDDEVNYLNYLFNRLWTEFPKRIMENGQLKSISGMNKVLKNKILHPPNFYPYYMITSDSTSLISNDWYDKFHKLVGKATTSIKIVTWSISLQNAELKELLIKKLEFGIKVDLLFAEHHFRRDSVFRDFLFTTQAKYSNFKYHIHPTNHSKFLLIDDEICFLSTKNYDAPSNFPQSIELGIEFGYLTDILSIWDKLVEESLIIEFKETKREYLHHLTHATDLNIHEDEITIWIWHPKKPVFNWLKGPDLHYISTKIQNSISIHLYKLTKGSKILQIFKDFNLHISPDSRLIRLENNRLNLDNLDIESKWILGCDKITFLRFVQN